MTETLPSSPTKNTARVLFEIKTQSPLSFTVYFAGEFLDEFPEEEGAEGFCDDWVRRLDDFQREAMQPAVEEATAELVKALSDLVLCANTYGFCAGNWIRVGEVMDQAQATLSKYSPKGAL